MWARVRVAYLYVARVSDLLSFQVLEQGLRGCPQVQPLNNLLSHEPAVRRYDERRGELL
jgi:hypothetical protein